MKEMKDMVTAKQLYQMATHMKAITKMAKDMVTEHTGELITALKI